MVEKYDRSSLSARFQIDSVQGESNSMVLCARVRVANAMYVTYLAKGTSPVLVSERAF